jgi:sugar O-acyltransferase (sialic acid O-acetyltransferase NeuD family)
MASLCILGASGHGKVVADAAEMSGVWDNILFYDDKWPEKKSNGAWKIEGTVKDFFSTSPKGKKVVVAIGDNLIRLDLSAKLRHLGFELVSIIHPGAIVSKYATVGEGTVIFAGCIVNAFVNIGRDCIINTGSTIDHDCDLADGVHVSPGAHLSGTVKVGTATWIGVGSCVRQNIEIGRNSIVGAGAVVVSPVDDHLIVIGNPARKYEKSKH